MSECRIFGKFLKNINFSGTLYKKRLTITMKIGLGRNYIAL